MAQLYGSWDLYEEVYQGKRSPDKADVKARERKEPEKMVVPMTYAQVQSFVAYGFQLFTQRPHFFEMVGTGVEDWKAAKVAEALLDRDLEYNQFLVKLYQFLLNIGRFGLGVLKHGWVKDMKKEWVKVPGQQMPSLSGLQMFGNESMELQDVVKFLGNKIDVISPYRWFPDPKLPITRFQEGDFCASELDVTKNWLRKMERGGMFSGTQWVKDMGATEWDARNQMGLRSSVTYDTASGKQKGGVILADAIVEIVPSEFKVNGEPIGDEDYPVKYCISIANDQRIVKCEPHGYLHDNFNYSAAQLSPDDHNQVNAGVAELINELQSTITWLFNTRITSVRKTIQNQFVVDSEGIEMEDLEQRRPVIRLKKQAARMGVDRFIKQLDVKDVTASHVQDAEMLGQLMQIVTGINENALGQYSQGRRSAEQTRAVNSGAASRLKMFMSLVWTQGLQPLGRDMLSNLRDGLDVSQIVKVTGLQTLQPTSPYAVGAQDFVQFLGVTKADLVGNYDFVILDGTLPSEKGRVASMLQELLMGVLTNPQAAAILGLDAKALLTEIAELNDIRNPERFFLQPPQQQAIMAAAAQSGRPEIADGAGSAAITAGNAGLPATPPTPLGLPSGLDSLMGGLPSASY